jgi:hypothetical protein
MKNLLTALFVTILTTVANSHEGHDHGVPKGIAAPKGGLIREIEKTYVEVVAKGNNIKIYLYDKELKPQNAELYTITAQAQKPRVKKIDEVKLTIANNILEATYDAAGIHRYTLILKVKDPKEDHADTLKFVIEPKK